MWEISPAIQFVYFSGNQTEPTQCVRYFDELDGIYVLKR